MTAAHYHVELLSAAAPSAPHRQLAASTTISPTANVASLLASALTTAPTTSIKVSPTTAVPTTPLASLSSTGISGQSNSTNVYSSTAGYDSSPTVSASGCNSTSSQLFNASAACTTALPTVTATILLPTTPISTTLAGSGNVTSSGGLAGQAGASSTGAGSVIEDLGSSSTGGVDTFITSTGGTTNSSASAAIAAHSSNAFTDFCAPHCTLMYGGIAGGAAVVLLMLIVFCYMCKDGCTLLKYRQWQKRKFAYGSAPPVTAHQSTSSVSSTVGPFSPYRNANRPPASQWNTCTTAADTPTSQQTTGYNHTMPVPPYNVLHYYPSLFEEMANVDASQYKRIVYHMPAEQASAPAYPSYDSV